MRGLAGESSWPYESRETEELEDRVARWLAQHDAPPARWSALLIGGTFLAMVLFAALH